MDTILIKKHGKVVVATLNRPKSLNALNTDLMHELLAKLKPLDKDPDVGCFVIKGSEKVFAAGADIKEMQQKAYIDVFYEDFFAGWKQFTDLRTPKIAAVSGYALGGGCELAMMCDMIFASDTAKFGQPEIKLGVIPGIGGSQRLTKLVGKSKAMDMILTGRIMEAKEAERAGLVTRVIPASELMDEVMQAAKTIAGYSKPSVLIAREVVEKSQDLNLHDGILFERRSFHALFAMEDQKEGMDAFLEKRPPVFKGK